MIVKKNEQGYALIIVLMLIVFVSIISAVFMRASISNAKQERIVDKNHLSNVAAEMGVEYYKTIFINEYNLTKDDLLLNAENELKTYMNGLKSEKIKDKPKYSQVDLDRMEKDKAKLLQEAIAKDLRTNLQRVLDIQRSTNPEGNLKSIAHNTGFLINNLNLIDNKNHVLVDGNVVGTRESKESKLAFVMSFQIPDLLAKDGVGNTGGTVSDWYSDISMPKMIKPENLCTNDLSGKTCLADKNTILGNASNSKIYFPDDYNWDKIKGNDMGKNFNGSTFYSKKEMKFKNMNNAEKVTIISEESLEVDQMRMKKTNIYIGEELEVNKHLTVEDSLVYVKGEMDVKDHFTAIKSKIYVGDEFEIKKKMNLIDSLMEVIGDLEIEDKAVIKNSTLFIHGNFETGGKGVEIKENSKVCILGDEIDVKKLSIDTTSWLYIYKSNKDLLKNSRVKKVDSLADLKKECNYGSGSTGSTVSWSDPIIEVSY